MLVIGLTGRARSGKGTVAQAIAQDCKGRCNCKIYEISEFVLADLNRCGRLPGKTRSMLDAKDLALLVEHGHRMRKMNKGYWLDYIIDEIDKDKPDVAILPNIRFENEARFVRNAFDANGKIIRVRSLISDGIDYISLDRDPNDPMETENLRIDADYFLTVRKGQTALLKEQAVTLFDYILRGSKN